MKRAPAAAVAAKKPASMLQPAQRKSPRDMSGFAAGAAGLGAGAGAAGVGSLIYSVLTYISFSEKPREAGRK
jgi:hypothetical protein